MSKAREKYYAEESGSWLTISKPVAHYYIKELEQQVAQLRESQKQQSIIKLCNRLDKAEQQKAELIEYICFPCATKDYDCDICKFGKYKEKI